ncbi:erythromycin esterase family protein [Flavobacterium sp. 3HN19-14]|uniref:erythromycin esterase family protein n=1 Tax=Flavobacterium sp. 3HN19-14 TaxID=3448133 RepID=UPI003EDF2092
MTALTSHRSTLLKISFLMFRIIGLGESSHFMGETYTAKTKIVKFLHEKCGFDVLAFECPMYNLSVVNDSLKKGEIALKDMRWNISGVWNTKEMEELFNYVIATYKTQHPLILAGFDESFFNSSCLGNIKKDYALFISNLEKETKTKIDLDSLFYDKLGLVAEKSYSFAKQPTADTLYLHNKFDEIRNVLNSGNLKQSVYFNFWKRITDNLESVYRKKYSVGKRDAEMADNIIFLADQLYRDKKIILWAATTHLLYNPIEIADFRKDKSLEINKAGVFLKKTYGKQYYLLAFTALQGKIGNKGYLGLAKYKLKTTKTSIERYIEQNTTANYAFLSLTDDDAIAEIKRNGIQKSSLWPPKKLIWIFRKLLMPCFILKMSM